MISDLKQEWSDRQVRKTAYMNPGTVMATTINFTSYPRLTTRTEMPNKNNSKPKVPKIEIEQVHHMRLLRRGKSLPGTFPQSARPSTANTQQSSAQKAFYYSSSNEIISLEEFFQVQKGMEGYRKKRDKANFYLALEERRQKVEDSHTERAVSASKRSCYSLAVSPMMKTQSQPTNQPKPSAFMFGNVPPLTIRPFTVTARVSAPSLSTDINNKSIDIKEQPQENGRKRVVLKQRLLLKPSNSELFSTQDLQLTKGSVSCKGFTSRQKFTEKEINRHLLVGIVTPRPQKHGGKAVGKEKAFVTMFKDPRVMDLQVEATIRKAKRMIDDGKSFTNGDLTGILRIGSPEFSEKGGDTSRRKCWSARSKDVGIMSGRDVSHVKSALSEAVSNEVDGNVDGKLIGKKIQENIKSINQVLNTTTPRLLAGSGNYPPRYNEGKRLKKRIPLRAEVEQKYNLLEHIRQHKDLSRKMKDVTKAMVKEAGQSGINNQTYVNFYA